MPSVGDVFNPPIPVITTVRFLSSWENRACRFDLARACHVAQNP